MILVFGSINIDVMVPVPRLPLPGDTVLGGDYALLPGGKGANQALAARRAGAVVALAGAVGSDAFADAALDLLRRGGVGLALVHRLEKPTGCAAIMTAAKGENLIAVAPGANAGALAAQVPDAALGPQTILVCQMEVPAVETLTLLHRARAAGARTVLNLAPAAPIETALLGDIDVLVANRGEAAVLGDDPTMTARRLGLALIVTQGNAGSLAYLADGGRIETPSLAIDSIDTTGAGDTFVGVLAAALDARAPFEMAMRRASAAAALTCLAPGAQSAMPGGAAIDAAVARLPG